MGRKTKQNKITNPELINKINPENIRLMKDYLNYLTSIQRSKTTIDGYKNDLEIFFTWNLLNNKNKFFVDLTKRDLISFQGYLYNDNSNSPARIRRIKSVLSSLSNYIENILDEDFPNFRSIIKKVENPINEKVREKTVLSEEQLNSLLDNLVSKGDYMKACLLALAMCSGRRKSELLRFKVKYFDEENLMYGSLYRTPEKIKTKGRGVNGKQLYAWTLKTQFKPYLDLWLDERKRLRITDEYLFVSKNKVTNESKLITNHTLNSCAITFSKILGIDFYWHSLRHYFCTYLKRANLPDEIIQEIIGWDSAEMIKIYNDIPLSDSLGKYFDENGLKRIKETKLSDIGGNN